ncbi:MAG: ATP-binding protein, partial [Planctomycetota bacterium]
DREFVAASLRDLGMDDQNAGDLASGLRRLQLGDIDLVLLDLGLPDSDGLQTLMRLLADHPHVPVVVMTANDDDAIGLAAIRAGAQDYLVKGSCSRREIGRAILYATERACLRARLASTHAELEQVLEHAPVVLYRLSMPRQGPVHLDFISDNARHILGDASETLRCRPLRFLRRLSRSGLDAIKRVRAQVLDNKPLPALEHGYHHPVAGPRWLIHRFRHFEGGENPVLLGCLQDASEQLELRSLQARAETMRAAVDAKHEFLATVSHELRNPLAAVLGYAELLQRHLASKPDQKGQGLTHRMLLAGERLQTMVEDLLEFAGHEARRAHLRKDSIDVVALLRSAAQEWRRSCSERGIELHEDLPESSPSILGDWLALRLVFDNLVGNAVKYTPSGGRIHLSLRHDVEAPHLLVRVEDTGFGIEADQIGQLFTPFHRGADVRVQSRSGLGLGLALVKEVVQAHYGDVRVHSGGRGRGSTFEVVLPLAKGRTAAASVLHRQPLRQR